MENRIKDCQKDCQLDLFANRMSAHAYKANQLRLLLAAFAYVLIFMPERTPSEMTGMWLPMVLMAAPSLIVVAPCGLLLALACRRLWWLGFRRAAWGVGAALGTVTVAASLLLGLLGPLAIVVAAVVLSLPVWIAALWLARRS